MHRVVLALVCSVVGVLPIVASAARAGDSEEAAWVRRRLHEVSGQMDRQFCREYKFRYITENFSKKDSYEQREAKVTQYLEENGYLTNRHFEDLTGGGRKYAWTPTTKLWELADRRDDDCFYSKTPIISNIKIVREEKHPQYDSVTILYVSHDTEYSKYDLVRIAAMGMQAWATKETRRRYLFAKDPFTGSPKLLADDDGAAAGWHTNRVPEAIAKISAGGPDAAGR